MKDIKDLLDWFGGVKPLAEVSGVSRDTLHSLKKSYRSDNAVKKHLEHCEGIMNQEKSSLDAFVALEMEKVKGLLRYCVTEASVLESSLCLRRVLDISRKSHLTYSLDEVEGDAGVKVGVFGVRQIMLIARAEGFSQRDAKSFSRWVACLSGSSDVPQSLKFKSCFLEDVKAVAVAIEQDKVWWVNPSVQALVSKIWHEFKRG